MIQEDKTRAAVLRREGLFRENEPLVQDVVLAVAEGRNPPPNTAVRGWSRWGLFEKLQHRTYVQALEGNAVPLANFHSVAVEDLQKMSNDDGGNQCICIILCMLCKRSRVYHQQPPTSAALGILIQLRQMSNERSLARASRLQPGLLQRLALGAFQLCQNRVHDCLPFQERTILFVVDTSIQEAAFKIGKLFDIATQWFHLQEAGKPLAKGRDCSQRPPSLAEDLSLKLHGHPPCCPLRSSMPR